MTDRVRHQERHGAAVEGAVKHVHLSRRIKFVKMGDEARDQEHVSDRRRLDQTDACDATRHVTAATADQPYKGDRRNPNISVQCSL